MTRAMAGFATGLIIALPAALPVAFPATAGTLDGVEGKPGIAMHGDLKYKPGFTHFDYVNPTAPKGGTVRLHTIGTFDNFNTFIIKGNGAAGTGFTYNTLMSGSADEAFSQYGELAEEVFMPEDRSWVAFKLRKEAKWHDGKPVTVADVIWSFNTLIEKGSPFYRFYYGSVAKVREVAKRTVRFDFKPGENRELPLILGQLTVLPKHYWASRDFTKTTLEPPLGSGPYKVKSFEAGRFVTIERVKDYWGKDLPVHRGNYNFNTIRFDYYRDSTIALEAFKAGEYDYRSENSSKAWATAYKFKAVEKGLIKKEKISHNRSSGMQGFVYNTRRKMFKDPKLRAALAYGFDFEWSNKNLFYGQYARSRSYFDNSELAATGLPGPDELKLLEPFKGKIPDKVFTKSYSPPTGGGPKPLRKNLRIAGKLLKEAGWVIKDGKRVNAETGKALEFEVLLVSPLFERVVLPFAKNLEKLGVKISVRTVDSSQYRRRLQTYDFDMIVSGFGQSLSPGNEQRNYWGSTAADLEGGRNSIGIKDPVIDQLIEKVIAAPSRQGLIAAVRSLDRVLQWGHWVIPHWHATYDRVAYWDKFGRPKITPIQGNQFTAWWVDPARDKALAGKLQSAKE
ncbi:MAG: ABC transporter substrate-binding protein [Rhodospirillaceae bacterium]|nr:ABC transporter substrate-binding protein [Rhodospirillaceae bacterium]